MTTEGIADKFNKAVQHLRDSLASIRYGGITAGFIDTVKVSYYGQQTPIRHIAQTQNDRDSILITPYESTMVGPVNKAMKEAGFFAYPFSKTSVRVSASPMSGKDREQVKAQVRKLGEDAKIAVRGVRKLARQAIDAETPKDDKLKLEDDIQKGTSEAEGEIDRIVGAKLKDIG